MFEAASKTGNAATAVWLAGHLPVPLNAAINGIHDAYRAGWVWTAAALLAHYGVVPGSSAAEVFVLCSALWRVRTTVELAKLGGLGPEDLRVRHNWLLHWAAHRKCDEAIRALFGDGGLSALDAEEVLFGQWPPFVVIEDAVPGGGGLLRLQRPPPVNVGDHTWLLSFAP